MAKFTSKLQEISKYIYGFSLRAYTSALNYTFYTCTENTSTARKCMKRKGKTKITHFTAFFGEGVRGGAYIW